MFKGLSPATKKVWVDPGSFTSCYNDYRRGEEYLVFAKVPSTTQATVAAMTVMKNAHSARPLPQELTSPNPPPIYLAPECMGSRDTHYPDFEKDLLTLRQYGSGAPVAPVMGQVLLAPNDPWSGKGRLAGVDVLLDTGKGVRHSTTNSEGKFFFN